MDSIRIRLLRPTSSCFSLSVVARMILLREWQKIVHLLNIEKGFYDEPGPHIDQQLLLAVGELVEAQNELRAGHVPAEVYYKTYPFHNQPGLDHHGDKPEGFGIELADAVIRIMDISESVGVDLEACIELKHAYNETREHKHGKNF